MFESIQMQTLSSSLRSLTKSKSACNQLGVTLRSARLYSVVKSVQSSNVEPLQMSPILQQALQPPTEEEIEHLVEFFRRSSKLLTITGAGVSTSSGIPDYRGPDGSYKKGHKPMSHQDFVSSAYSRKRYWARSMSGWARFSTAKPNAAHLALRDLETDVGILFHLVTQNVDRLHAQAGSQHLTDLHGRIDQVCCLQCQYRFPRKIMQEWLVRENAGLAKAMAVSLEENPSLLRADGDADIVHFDTLLQEHSMHIPTCPNCQTGTLKPDVVFFGDNVPADRVNRIYEDIDSHCDGVLVVGSSLEVFSAYRFVHRAATTRHLPIAIVNYGVTRAERQSLPNIVYKSEAQCGSLLQSAVSRLREGF